MSTSSRTFYSHTFSRVITLLAILAVAFSNCASAQSTGQIAGIGNTTSTPVPGVPHDYITGLSEIVNPANGALSIRIKAPTPHERGSNWSTYAFTYDSDGQYTLVPTWFTSQGGGNLFTALTTLGIQGALPPSVIGQTTDASVILPSGNGVSTTYECQITNGFVYTDPEGGRHGLGLGIATPIQGANACGHFPAAFNQTVGGDAQYKAYLLSTNPVEVKVADMHGNAFTYVSNGTLYTEDPNGNYQSSSISSTNNTSTITLSTATGRVETTYETSSGYTLTLPDVTTPSGHTAPYVATYGSISPPSETLHVTAVNEGEGGNACQATSITDSTIWQNPPNPVTSLSLPNGENYTFSYDPTFGLINKITYPTGAWVEYTWSVIPNAEGVQYRAAGFSGNGGLCAVTHDWFAITKRVVSYDGSAADEEQDFSYTTTWPATGQQNSYQWISKTTTVTTKDLLKGTSSNTVYTYSPILPPAESPAAWEDLGYVPQENTIQYYDTNASLLKTVAKTWQSMSLMSGECETLPNGSTSGKFYTYEQYSGFGSQGSGVLNSEALWTNLPTDVAEYDYGQVSSSQCARPSAGVIPVRETETAYASLGNTTYFQYGSMFDRPSKVQVYGNVSGAQTLQQETDYVYDGIALSSVSGSIYNHDSLYPSGNTVRGNPTQVTRVCTVQSTAPCSYADSISNYTYDIAGQVVSSKDPNGNTTNYTYSDSSIAGDGSAPSGYVTDAFLSTITEPSVGSTTFQQTFTWGYNDGRMWSKTDENLQPTKFYYTTGGKNGSSYDPFFRLTEADYPDTGYEKVSYNDSTPAVTVTTAINTQSNPVVTETKETVYQAMGQYPIHAYLQTDPVQTRTVDTTYDGLNRVSTLTNPYWSGTSEPSDGATTYTYDALNRTRSLAHADATSQNWQYTNNTVLFTDENGNQWQRTSDALGRLTQVLEPNGTSLTPTMETDYTYDALGNLTNVTQWGGPHGTSGSRTRTFVYNGLSELRTSANPENGTLAYTYDANGNVLTRIDGRTVKTTYGPYDSHNRPAGKSYNDGLTPSVTYTYDSSSISGAQNTKTRLTNATVTSGSNVISQVSPYNYDSMGRVQDIQDCVPTSVTACANKVLTYGYNQAGNVASMIDNAASPALTINSTYDGADQLSLVASTSSWGPPTLFQANSTNSSAPSYGAVGLMNASLGVSSGGTAMAALNRSYDSRVQVTGETDMRGSNTVYSYSIEPYNKNNPPASGYDAVGNVVSFSDFVMGTWNYTYDTLNRVATASAIAGSYSSAAMAWTVDAFGDRKAQSVSGHPSAPMPLNWSATMSTGNNNRIAVSTAGTWSYDGAGDVLSDAVNSYLYDGEARICAVKNATGAITGYLYDGNGDRIAKGTLSTFSCNLSSNGFVLGSSYVVDKDGEQLTELGSTDPHTNIFADGKLLATYANSQVYFVFSDWLGTKRAVIGTSCTSTYASLAYGDELTPNGTCLDATEHHYTGKERDIESGNDFFLARYYSSGAGRFISPDPGPYTKEDPQTWNRYSYSRNGSLKYSDPTGKYFVIDSGNTAAMHYISMLLRSDSGRALVTKIAGDSRPTIISGGRLPNVPEGNGKTDITNGQTKVLAGNSPGQFVGTSVVLDPVNQLLTAMNTGKSPDSVGVDAFAHELFHVSDINSTDTLGAAVEAGRAGDAPSAPGDRDTAGGTAEQRAQEIMAELGPDGITYTPDAQYDAEATQIINSGNQQFENATQQQQDYLKQLWFSLGDQQSQ